MGPGEQQGWAMSGFAYGMAATVTASPVIGDPTQPQPTLAVDNVQVVGNSDGTWSLLFTVENVGGSSIDAYGMGIGLIAK
jgi:hypothetical protein